MPAVEAQPRRKAEMLPERRSDLVQGIAVGRLIGREVEAPGRLAQRPQQEGLAPPALAGDDAKGRTRPVIVREGGKLHPLDVTVEHVVRLVWQHTR